MSIEKQLLTRAEAAAYLGLAVQTLASWASSGRHNLPMAKFGTTVRYRKSDLDAWIAAHVTGTPTGADPTTAA